MTRHLPTNSPGQSCHFSIGPAPIDKRFPVREAVVKPSSGWSDLSPWCPGPLLKPT